MVHKKSQKDERQHAHNPGIFSDSILDRDIGARGVPSSNLVRKTPIGGGVSSEGYPRMLGHSLCYEAVDRERKYATGTNG